MEFSLAKYLIGQLLMPLPMFFLLLLTGGLLKRFNRKKLATGLTVFALVALYACSIKPVADVMLKPLEFRYANYAGQKARYVIVLGCGHNTDKHLPPSSQLQPCARIRLTEGINIAKANPGSQLVLSGSSFWDKKSHAEAMRQAAIKAGIPDRRIISIPQPHDTYQESVAIAPVVVDSPTVLVTSASHMPRAVKLFNDQGITVIPAPTDYLTRRKGAAFSLFDLMPDPSNLKKVQRALHEYYGMLWSEVHFAVQLLLE